MYLHLELKLIPTELQSDAVERLARLHRLMSQSPGFLDAQICADVNEASNYMVIRAWEDAAAHAGYRASDAAKAFAANRPPQPLWENTAVQEWVSVSANPESARSTYVTRAQTEPPRPRWEQVLASPADSHGARSFEPAQVDSALFIPVGSETTSAPEIMLIQYTEESPGSGVSLASVPPDSLVFDPRTLYRVVDDVRRPD